jgi:HB1, ASXL, restriction endonuclease HTH domain
MTDAAAKWLRSEIEKAERELAEVTQRLEHLRYTLAYHEQQDGTEEGPHPAKVVPNAIYEILDGEGRELYYKEIYRRLQERKIVVKGQNPASNVISHMSGDTRFVNMGRGIWGLKKWSGRQVGDAQPVAAAAVLERTRLENLGAAQPPDPDEGQSAQQEDSPPPFTSIYRSVGSR